MQNEINIGRIKKVPLREIWNREDKDFTRWLEKNIEYLNEILDFDITIESREGPVGPYKVDLYGEDNFGRKVIIENQLEKTDHTHLGQIITYLVNLEASSAIWITSKPIEEHIKTIEWLNETTPDDISFYLIKIEALKIESQPSVAPLFTLIKSPSNETKQIGAEKKEYAQRHVLRKEFWTQLLDKSRKKTKLYMNISPNIYSWVGAGAGKTGINYNYVINNRRAACEIYIDKGKAFEDPNINKIRFDKLLKNKEKIEKEFDRKLNWERLDNRRASRIAIYFEGIGIKDKEKWDNLQDTMIDTIVKMESVFKKYISQLD